LRLIVRALHDSGEPLTPDTVRLWGLIVASWPEVGPRRPVTVCGGAWKPRAKAYFPPSSASWLSQNRARVSAAVSGVVVRVPEGVLCRFLPPETPTPRKRQRLLPNVIDAGNSRRSTHTGDKVIGPIELVILLALVAIVGWLIIKLAR
jgi:hypothetical protein